jgi:hypothetical protein
MKKKYIIIALFIFSVLFTLGSFGYKYLGNSYSVSIKNDTEGAPNEVISDMYNPPEDIVPEGSLISMVRKYIVEDKKIEVKDINITAIQNNEEFAKVLVSLKTLEGGDLTIFARTKGETWEVVYMGTDIVPCGKVDPIDFPGTIANVCMDESTNELKDRLNI